MSTEELPFPTPVFPPAAPAPPAADTPFVDFVEDEKDEDTERGLTSDDLSDRTGYYAAFLGTDAIVPLPYPTASIAADVLRFATPDGDDDLLRYTHFSVMMHKTRRMCLFSAVNIDGTHEHTDIDKRPGWRFDPRIPRPLQIKTECYGDQRDGKFSRGHMTRREDPIWGQRATAEIANRDTFFVTNACPQWQPFNGGVWLGLEDYALEHTREGDIRVSVLTGPVLTPADPAFFGVPVPLAFWKVIAFIHNQTGKLSATGYTMQATLPEERDGLTGYPFGPYQTYQTAITDIEAMTGLSFGHLSALDPLAGRAIFDPTPLADFGQIQFV